MAMLVNYLDDEDISILAPEIGRRELERYFECLRQRPNFRTGESLSHSYLAKRYRHLQQFWRWLDNVEKIVEFSPLCKMEVPHVSEEPPAVLRGSDEGAARHCKGEGVCRTPGPGDYVGAERLRSPDRRAGTVVRGEPAEPTRGSLDFDFDVIRAFQPCGGGGAQALLSCLCKPSLRQAHDCGLVRWSCLFEVNCRSHSGSPIATMDTSAPLSNVMESVNCDAPL
ncbi:hypothetical protein [Amycolatopsis sp. NPDC004079]|uniref:hypothetical protein n=1 Tax=Amycolatopsis sp. NPDC004079 TaxID=3154549 RepID=UPI0033A1BEE6